MAIGREAGEAAQIIPDLFVGCVEQMRPVAVDLDAGGGILFGVGIAADVSAPVDHQHAPAELRGDALGERRAIKARADNENVGFAELVLVHSRICRLMVRV